jgi:hypothetical protein
MALSGYSRHGRKARRTRRGSKRAGFGGTAAEHNRAARTMVATARTEVSAFRQHLREGDCHAAARALAFVGYGYGKLAAERYGARGKRGARRAGTTAHRRATGLLKFVDQFAQVCKV